MKNAVSDTTEFAKLGSIITSVKLSGAVNKGTVPSVEKKIAVALGKKPAHMIFNLQGVTCIDSKGMELFVETADYAQRMGIHCSLVHVDTRIAVALHSMGINTLFGIYADEQQAMANCAKKSEVASPAFSPRDWEFIEQIRAAIKRDSFSLPLLPGTAIKLMDMSNDPRSNPEDFEGLINQDPSIASALLKVANSCIYARALPVTTISAAIVRLGRRRLRSMIVGISLGGNIIRGQEIDILARDLWHHSMVCAMLSGSIAKTLHRDDSVVFTAGLLHDIHKAVLLSICRDLVKKSPDYFPSPMVLEHVYKEHFLAILSILEKKWNIPESLLCIIREVLAPAGTYSDMEVEIVSLANKIAEFTRNKDELDVEWEVERLAISANQLAALIEGCRDIYMEVSKKGVA